jgi:hypothetical protein
MAVLVKNQIMPWRTILVDLVLRSLGNERGQAGLGAGRGDQRGCEEIW